MLSRTVRAGALALVVLAVAGTPFRASAQQPVAPAPWVVAAQAGNYNFTQYNRTQLQENYLAHLTGAAAADRDYFRSAVGEIEHMLAELLRISVFGASAEGRVGGLKWLSDQATVGGAFIPATEYLQAVNRFQAQRVALENRIESLTSITQALPSRLQIRADGSGLQDAPGYGNINFAPIRDFYRARIAEIVTLVTNLEQHVTLNAQAPRPQDRIQHIIQAGRGTSLVVPRPPTAVPRDQILAWTRQVQTLRNWDADAIDDMNRFTVDFCKAQVQAFIRLYGERWTTLSAEDRQQQVRDATDIVHTFWARSYLRGKWGMPVGAIGINYERFIGNLDVAFSRTGLRFIEEPVWDPIRIPRLLRNFRDSMARMAERSTTFRNAGAVGDGRLGWVASGRNLVTYLSGHRNLAIAQGMILSVLAADMYEEQVIIQPGGVEVMKDRYRARYAANQDDRDFYRRLANALDPRDGQVQGGVASNGLADHFGRVRGHMRLKLVDLMQADAVQANIDAATGANRWQNLVDQRGDDLLRD